MILALNGWWNIYSLFLFQILWLNSYWNQTRWGGEPESWHYTFSVNVYGCVIIGKNFMSVLDNWPPDRNWKQWANLPEGNSRAGTRTGMPFNISNIMFLKISSCFQSVTQDWWELAVKAFYYSLEFNIRNWSITAGAEHLRRNPGETRCRQGNWEEASWLAAGITVSVQLVWT